MSLFLAVDAGGTRTTFLLARGDVELARVVAGTIKRLRTDEATAGETLHAALTELSRRAGESLTEVEVTCVGAAGFSVPLVADWMRAAFEARVGGRFLLAGDVEIALDAAFSGEPGVVLLSGTGSNVAGRLLSGEVVTAGGWGPALSDQASGYSIGRAGLRAAVVERDVQGGSTLLTNIMTFWGVPDFQSLVDFAHRQPPPDLSRLSPLIVDRAIAGDAVAGRVLDQETADLAVLARAILTRVHASTGLASPPRLAFAGSIMEHVPLVRDRMTALLREDLPTLQTLPGVVDPVRGALWRARQVTHAPTHRMESR